ncbi:progranulin-like [Conger conger]|nr:progranulin-like [Conger conger]
MLRVVVLVLLPLGLASSHVTYCNTDTGYKCCPVPNAILCPDRCCPQGFQCNTQTQMCERPVGSMPIQRKMAAKPSSLALPNRAVSDPKMEKQNECCMGSRRCCAVGFHCDERKACVRDKSQHPSTELQDSLSTGSQGVVIYCDRRFYCPPNNTCCKNVHEQWACCPYRLGQCCQDKMHCCAYRYTCDRRSTSCIKEYARIPAALKEAAKRN